MKRLFWIAMALVGSTGLLFLMIDLVIPLMVRSGFHQSESSGYHRDQSSYGNY